MHKGLFSSLPPSHSLPLFPLHSPLFLFVIHWMSSSLTDDVKAPHWVHVPLHVRHIILKCPWGKSATISSHECQWSTRMIQTRTIVARCVCMLKCIGHVPVSIVSVKQLPALMLGATASEAMAPSIKAGSCLTTNKTPRAEPVQAGRPL